MSKRIIFLLLSISVPFFTFGIMKNNKPHFPKKVLFTVNFDEKTKINGLLIKPANEQLNDEADKLRDNADDETLNLHNENSADAVFNENQSQSQNDSDKSENETPTKKKEIYLSEEQTQFYREVLNKNKSDLEMNLFKVMKSNDVKTAFFRSLENSENVPELHVYMENYQSGEFNLIKNINTQMTYRVEVISKNKKNIAKIRKKYIVKTVSSMPLEAQRLSEINERFAKELFRLMTKYLQDKTEIK